MFSALLLCCSFSLLRFSVSLVHGNVPLDDEPPDTAYLSNTNRGQAPMQEPILLPLDSVEDHFLLESYDHEPATELQLQGRSMRSPRRCIPHQQSCLGFPLPCCDPCDTCYCRFFNAICYCRKVGHACPARLRA